VPVASWYGTVLLFTIAQELSDATRPVFDCHTGRRLLEAFVAGIFNNLCPKTTATRRKVKCKFCNRGSHLIDNAGTSPQNGRAGFAKEDFHVVRLPTSNRWLTRRVACLLLGGDRVASLEFVGISQALLGAGLTSAIEQKNRPSSLFHLSSWMLVRHTRFHH
jgi:hypothetical protein